MLMTQSGVLFLIAGLFEIGGGYLVAIGVLAAIAGKFWEKYCATNETKGSGA